VPLDKEHTTVGGWTALVAYPPFLAIVGATFAFTDPEVLRATPALAYADKVVPLQTWGFGFLTVAATLGVAAARRDRSLFQVALGVGIVWLAVWSLLLVFSYFDGNSSPSAWAWPAVVAWHMWAVERSLASRQTG
jgi:hypothetical protein